MTTRNETVSKTILYSKNEGPEEIVQYQSQIMPRFGEFQLLGDGLLVRFADQILQQHPGISYGTRAVGYCVNGQRIHELRQRIKTKSYPLSPKVLVLIGTTDVLCGSNINTMTKNFSALLNLLKRTTEKILILTLPPIPKLSATYFHWTLIRQFNSFLKTLDDGLSITVADICPLFTKFKGALEYHIGTDESEANCFEKRKYSVNHRGKLAREQREVDDLDSDKSETDYRNTTDTNTSIDSEIVSSELSQDRENTRGTDAIGETEVAMVRSRCKGGSGRVRSPVRFVVRTLQSVFGKDMLNKKNKTESKSTPHTVKQPEKTPRNSPFEDDWEAESDEDSMSEHVYKSQEETEYDEVETGSQRKKTKCGEFSKFLESLNENETTPRMSFQCRKWKRDCTRNERPDTTESSSSSDSDSLKSEIRSFVDRDFRYFLEKSWHNFEFRCSSSHPPESLNEAGQLSFSSSSAQTENQLNDCRESFMDWQTYKNVESACERDKLIIHLAGKICHLDCYEIFFPFGKRRMNMVQLNRKGLLQLKNFLLCNNYVSI